MKTRRTSGRTSAVFASLLLLPWVKLQAMGAEALLAKGGRAEAVIVVGRDASSFDRWVAKELQRYVQQLSGAQLPILGSDKVPAQKPLIVLGGPGCNPLAGAAQKRQLVHFADLKPDGFVLKRTELEGVPVLLAGGNDETGTMYAVYELLERLGMVFQLTGDIFPQQKPDLVMPACDVRMRAGVQTSWDALLPRNSLVHGAGGFPEGD